MLRKLLDRLYLWSGYAAAFFLAAIAVGVMAQIAGRSFGLVVDATEAAGFCMAASTFFALAHTFRRGAHVRVTLLVEAATGRSRKLLELVCCVIGALAVGFLAWHAIAFAAQSYRFGDISPGFIAMPMWIPQSAMAAGLLLLAISLVDEALMILRGRTPVQVQTQDTAVE